MTVLPDHVRELFEQVEAQREIRGRVYQSVLGPMEIHPLERKGVETVVDHFGDALDDVLPDLADEDLEAIVRSLTEVLAQNALLRKVMAGYELEWRVFNEGQVDGIVGNKIDEAIETLRPYLDYLDRELQ